MANGAGSLQVTKLLVHWSRYQERVLRPRREVISYGELRLAVQIVDVPWLLAYQDIVLRLVSPQGADTVMVAAGSVGSVRALLSGNLQIEAIVTDEFMTRALMVCERADVHRVDLALSTERNLATWQGEGAVPIVELQLTRSAVPKKG